MSTKNVCSDSWKERRGLTVILKNQNTNPVTVSATIDWPFSSPPSPFTIPARAGSVPGEQSVVLVKQPGTYQINVQGCKVMVNPKTVIIS